MMLRFVQAWGPAVALMGAIFVASSQPGSILPPQVQYQDKILHVCAYATLAFFVMHGLTFRRAHWCRRRIFALAFGIATLYGLSDEVHQYFVPQRHAEFADWAADAVGALFGVWVFVRVKRWWLRHAT